MTSIAMSGSSIRELSDIEIDAVAGEGWREHTTRGLFAGATTLSVTGSVSNGVVAGAGAAAGSWAVESLSKGGGSSGSSGSSSSGGGK